MRVGSVSDLMRLASLIAQHVNTSSRYTTWDVPEMRKPIDPRNARAKTLNGGRPRRRRARRRRTTRSRLSAESRDARGKIAIADTRLTYD